MSENYKISLSHLYYPYVYQGAGRVEFLHKDYDKVSVLLI